MTRSFLQWLRVGWGWSGSFKRSSSPSAKRKARLQVEPLEERAVPTGTWATLANAFPGNGAGLMLLLSDGTVMVQGGQNAETGGNKASKVWYKLTPDSTGSYI